MKNRSDEKCDQTRFYLLIIILCLITQALIDTTNAPYYLLGVLVVFCTMVLSYQIDKRFYELSKRAAKEIKHE